MCKAVEELCKKEKNEAMLDVTKRMLVARSLTLEKMVKYFGLTVKELKK